MKDFELFVQEGDVKKQPSDSNLAKSLVDMRISQANINNKSSPTYKCEKCGEIEFTESQARESLNKKTR